VDLQFQLGEEKTIVTSKIVVSPGAEGQNLTL
jgi:aminopeptidase N